MVLKQKSNVNIWGKTSSGKKVTVITSWNERAYHVIPTPDGKFKVSLKTPKAGGPYSVTIDDGDKIVLENVMIGEVWICSGQSNMEMPMKGYNSKQTIKNGAELIANSSNNQLRLFSVKKLHSPILKDDCDGAWQASNPAVVPSFSAVAFQYGQLLQKKLQVPIGIIDASVGGTPIRDWMGDSFDQFAEMYPNSSKDSENRQPKVFFNSMIYPLRNYAVSGFIWYQGEADRAKPELYIEMMSAMVKEWRSIWTNRNLGFYYAQIAPWTYPDDKSVLKSAFMRSTQYNLLKKIKNSGIAITADVGSDQSIHPPDKTTVAERLVRIALAKTYKETITYQGPEFSSLKTKGEKISLSFNYVGKGLALNEIITGNFEVAGSDQLFYPANAKLVGKKIELISAKVKQPIAVRYCFKDYFIGNLYNNDGLPAVPFRTDNW